MEVIEHTGVVRQVIDAVNAAFTEGELPTINRIKLTQAEMDEFIANNPFVGETGKFYGDDDRGSILEVTSGDMKQNDEGVTYIPVISFRLKGILVYVGDR